jgi:hypothetical protein
MKATLLAFLAGSILAIPLASALTTELAAQTPSLTDDLLKARITPPLITRPSGDLKIRISSPIRTNGIKGAVPIQAEARSSSKVLTMGISIDGNNVVNSNSPNVSYLWNADLADYGAHVIRIYAGDAEGNMGKIIKTVYK